MGFEIVYWHWFVAGLILMTLEAFAPGAVFLWMGVSAFIVGLLSWVMPSMSWEVQALLFGTLSIVSFFVYRKYKAAPVSDKPTLNRRGDSYVGRVFTLHVPIVNGIGKLHVDDSQWRIAGPDTPAGSQVRVTQAEGTTLRVARAE